MTRFISSLFLVAVTWYGLSVFTDTATADTPDAVEPIATDRPDFTEAAVSVGDGVFQFESGATFQWLEDGRTAGFPELLMRYGVTRLAELRLAIPDYNFSRQAGRPDRGWGDTYVGAKVQVGPFENGDELSLIPAITIPSRDGDYSTYSFDPELKACYSHDLSENWNLSMMGYILWTTIDQDRVASYQQTASFGRGLTDDLSVFFEYAGTYAERERAEHVAHSGFAYRFSVDAQADLHGGFTANGDNREPFIGIGYSRRFR